MNSHIRENLLYGIINQVFELEKKVKKLSESNSMGRNIDKLKGLFSEIGFVYHDPIGEAYTESRSDCEANISGASTVNLEVIETIKPIIRRKRDGFTAIVQKAVVVVESIE